MGMDIVGGTLGGALANQKEGSKNAGNLQQQVLDGMGGTAGTANVFNQALTGQQGYGLGQDNAAAVQSNPMLSGMFGAGGTMDRTNTEEQRLAGQGFQLQPEDHEAYGQASGNIARQFGQADQGLSQAMADRGLSNSGVAGAAFSGAQGNKNEQLAGLQHSIADSRMKMNQERLGQTRQFLGQMNHQANQAMNDQSSRGINQANQYNAMLGNKTKLMGGLLSGAQDQSNSNLEQNQQTEHGSNLSNTVSGFQQGKNQADQKVGSVASKASKK